MAAETGELDRKLAAIDAMLHPRSIAILGATERLQYGGRFLNNLLTTGCQARLYPVNPKRESIFGVPCYPSILEVPEPVDLAAIIIPAAAVNRALRECAERGARSALVISAGFAELKTEEGLARQAELQAIARESGVRVCGPNCLGLANVAGGMWAVATGRLSPETVALQGGIGLVSQSGATCFGPLIAAARDRGVGFRYVVSSGNEADLGAPDFIRYMLRDPEVRVVAALVEGFRDGAGFVAAAELALEMGKPLVLLKVGRSAVGSRAASSHTAAMTGSDVVQDALFRQQGVVRVDDYDELIETASMFLKARAPRGERVGVVSHSGGIGSFLADKCGEVGLELPALSPETARGLKVILGERGSAANPADVTGFATNESFPRVLDLLLDDPNLDLQIVASAGSELQVSTITRAVQEREKPVFFLWTGSFRDTAVLPKLQSAPVPLFYMPGRCARAVRRLLDYHRRRQEILAGMASGSQALPAPPEGALAHLREIAAGAGQPTLTEHESKRLLSLFGVPTTREALCTSLEGALRAGREIGYPVALKAMLPGIAHKTEAGAVRLGIAGPEALAAAYREMLGSVVARHPGATIDGVLVQEMVSEGIEVIVGISPDAQFGPVLMLGLGGVLVEALGAVAWRVCPLNPAEARGMIEDVKGLSRILAGYRGRPKADVGALVDTLVRLSHLALWAWAEVASLEVNPLAVLPEGQGVIALDALCVLTTPARGVY